MRRSTDSLALVLQALQQEHGLDLHLLVALAVPHHAVFYRRCYPTEAVSYKNGNLSPDAMADEFPRSPENLIVQVCQPQPTLAAESGVLAAATDHQTIQQRLDDLTEASYTCRLIDAPAFALCATVITGRDHAGESPVFVLHVDTEQITIAILSGRTPLAVRSLPITRDASDEDPLDHLAREIQLTWQAVFHCELPQNTEVFIAGDKAVVTHYSSFLQKKLAARPLVVNPFAAIQAEGEYDQEKDYSVAAGLALRVLMPDVLPGVDFLKAHKCHDENNSTNPRRQLRITGALLLAIGIISLFGIFTRLSRIESAYAQTKSEIRNLFHEVLPQEQNVVSEIDQMEEKLQALRGEYKLFAATLTGTIGPLDALQAMVLSIPEDLSVQVETLFITHESVELTGTCPRFDVVYKLQQLCQNTAEFNSVEIKDTYKDSETDLVRFRLSIQLTSDDQYETDL